MSLIRSASVSSIFSKLKKNSTTETSINSNLNSSLIHISLNNDNKETIFESSNNENIIARSTSAQPFTKFSKSENNVYYTQNNDSFIPNKSFSELPNRNSNEHSNVHTHEDTHEDTHEEDESDVENDNDLRNSNSNLNRGNLSPELKQSKSFLKRIITKTSTKLHLSTSRLDHSHINENMASTANLADEEFGHTITHEINEDLIISESDIDYDQNDDLIEELPVITKTKLNIFNKIRSKFRFLSYKKHLSSNNVINMMKDTAKRDPEPNLKDNADQIDYQIVLNDTHYREFNFDDIIEEDYYSINNANQQRTSRYLSSTHKSDSQSVSVDYVLLGEDYTGALIYVFDSEFENDDNDANVTSTSPTSTIVNQGGFTAVEQEIR